MDLTDGVNQGNESTRDAGCSCTTVRFEHVTIHGNQPLAQRGQIRYLFPPMGASSARVEPDADPPMRAALDGTGGFDALADYRGTPVLAVHLPVGYRDWALVTQVDADEAYAPIIQIRNVLWVAGVTLFGLKIAEFLNGG